MARSDDVYVVGVGMHAFGRHEAVPAAALATTACRDALADAGVRWSDIGFAAGGSNAAGKPDTLDATLGLTGVPFVNVRNGCATGGVALLTAAHALRLGEADLSLAVGFDKHPRGAFGSSPADYGLGEWYAQTGMMVTTQYFAMKTARYLHEHRVDPAVLSAVAARAYRNGAANPMAWRRKPITEAEIASADMVNDPLTKYMFCSPAAGAVALVLATAERAADLCEKPVRIASISSRTRRFGSFEVFSPHLPPSSALATSLATNVSQRRLQFGASRRR